MPKGIKKRVEAAEAKLNGIDKMIAEAHERKAAIKPDADSGDVKALEMLSTIENNISVLNSKRIQAQEELDKIREEGRREEESEKKEKNDKSIKGALIAAGIAKSEEKLWHFGVDISVDEKIDKIFEETDFLHIKKEYVEEIMNNKEFSEKHFRTKITNLDISTGLDLKRILDVELIRAAYVPTGDYQKDEEVFVKLLTENNGFEISKRKIADSNKNKGMEDDPEDLKKFNEIKALLEEVAKENAMAREKFAKSGNKSIRDNGYKLEMIKKEQLLSEKVNAFAKELNDRLQPDENGNLDNDDVEGTVRKYSLMKEITFDIDRQLKIDRCLEKNNELRAKMEMWYVYEKIKGKSLTSVREMKDLIADEEKAWSKPQKLKKEAISKGQAVEYSGDYALMETQLLLDRINEHKPFNDAERKKAKVCLAGLVLHELIKKEIGANTPKDKPYTVAFMSDASHKTFKEMSKRLAEHPSFDDLLKKVGVGKLTPQTSVKFLVEDLEKDIVKLAPPGFKKPSKKQITGAEDWKAEEKKKKEKEKKKERALEMQPNANIFGNQ